MEKSKTLLVFVPEECLDKGIKPGGWLDTGVVPAFDPELKPVSRIRQAFGVSEDRVLVQIVGDAVDWFQERRTGPQRKFQGIYATEKAIPSDFLRRANPTDYNE